MECFSRLRSKSELNRQYSLPTRLDSQLSGENSEYGYGRLETRSESKTGPRKSYGRSYSDNKSGQTSQEVIATRITEEMMLPSQIIRELRNQNPFLNFHVTLKYDEWDPEFGAFKHFMETEIEDISKKVKEKFTDVQIVDTGIVRREIINSAVNYYKKEIFDDFKTIKQKKDDQTSKKAKDIIKEYKYTRKSNEYIKGEDWNTLFLGVQMESLRIHSNPIHLGQIRSVDN